MDSHQNGLLKFFEVNISTFVFVAGIEYRVQTFTVDFIYHTIVEQILQFGTVDRPISILVQQLEQFLQVIYLEQLLFF